MKILEVNGSNDDFVYLCHELEKFQFNLMPILKEKGYNLTEGLHDIKGYILYVDEKPIGSIGLKKVSNGLCEIVRVFVCEEYRGRGYARILFDKIENLAKSLGFESAEIVAWSLAKSAVKLYKKLGYICSEEKDSERYVGLKYVEFLKKF